MGTDTLIKWEINEARCKPDVVFVQLLNWEYEQIAETEAESTSAVLFNNSSPEGVYHVRISWDIYFNVRDSYVHALGLENVNDGWYRPTLNLYASNTSIHLLWETIDQQIDFYTVIILEQGVIKKISHFDPQITSMTINHTNPCTMYEFSVGAKSDVSNQFFDLGHIRYDGGVPAIPNVTYLGGAQVQVRWTTNPYCTPDFIHVHFREPEGIGLMGIAPGTNETTVLTGVKQCTPYAIQLGFSYTNGKEYLSETVNMTFLSDGTFHNAPKLSLDQNGSLLVQWLVRLECVVNHTIVMVETNGRPAKAYTVVGDQSLIRLDDLEHCAFHTVYVTTQYENGLVERTHSSEINTFMSKQANITTNRSK
ncbi:hypothetical protein P879_03950 [Paragonimus westermani]|uniref:Fibronectin type-III domain-containing protein n=1 Tax=Paragonimus westermani TaxID=34504 RepID=A0A8T0DDI9_9TREM|nr:hypothetical protein P879_03950 [Paragonimus westermani]